MILWALHSVHMQWSDSIDGRGEPISLDALLMMRCHFYRESESRLPNQTVMDEVRMLSTMAVKKRSRRCDLTLNF